MSSSVDKPCKKILILGTDTHVDVRSFAHVEAALLEHFDARVVRCCLQVCCRPAERAAWDVISMSRMYTIMWTQVGPRLRGMPDCKCGGVRVSPVPCDIGIEVRETPDVRH